MRVRDIADAVGITHRAVQRIILDLEQAGILIRQRQGRRTHYELDRSVNLRHPLESTHSVGDLLAALES